MKVFYDDKVLYLGGNASENIKQYAISVMDAARKSDPQFAYCWNYCLVEFDDIKPIFYYFGNKEEVADCLSEGLSQYMLVTHSNIIEEKTKPQKR